MVDYIKVWTDGSCSPNPGNGGWAAIILHPDGSKEEMSGTLENSTNNVMEMYAAISVLEYLPNGSHIEIISDSQYLISTMNQQFRKLKNLNWWIRLERAANRHRSVKWKWIRGHHGYIHNERANILANEARMNGNGKS